MPASDHSTAANEPLLPILGRLLAPPRRPGQAFTMPGTNHDGVYRMACRLKACLDAGAGAIEQMAVCSDDRAVVAAALLATLAGRSVAVLPRTMAADRLARLRRQTGFTHALAGPAVELPDGVTRIDLDRLTDTVESLEDGDTPSLDRAWVRLADSGGVWTKSPRALLTEVAAVIDRYQVGHGDRILSTLPPCGHLGLIFSVMLPLTASARVVSTTPASAEAIARQMDMAAPTLLIALPELIDRTASAPMSRGALRLAFCGDAPLAISVAEAFTRETGVDLVELYGTPATGTIATRRLAAGETAFSAVAAVAWRIAGRSLDIRSAMLSPELPVRGSGWYTVAEGVQDGDVSGFLPPARPPQGAAENNGPADPDAAAGMVAGAPSAETGAEGVSPVNPSIRRHLVEIGWHDAPVDPVSPSLLDELTRRADLPSSDSISAPFLRQLGRYRGSLDKFTLVTHADVGPRRIIDGHHPRSLGFAVHLGVTSAAGCLCDLVRGTVLAAADRASSPHRSGHAGGDTDTPDRLQRLAIEGINSLMARCLERAGADPASIDEIAICAGTAMTQIAAGLDPHHLEAPPGLPLSLTLPAFDAGDLGLACDETAVVHFMPVISRQIGGDTVATILADRPHARDAVTLMVDMGRQATIVLGNREGLWAASCVSDPSMEGNERAVSAWLMRRAGVDRIDRAVITGAIGTDLNDETALARGLLPPAAARGRIVARPGLAVKGVVMALLDRQRRNDAVRLCRRIHCLDALADG